MGCAAIMAPHCKKGRAWQGQKRNLGLSLRQKDFSNALAQICFSDPAMSDFFYNTMRKVDMDPSTRASSMTAMLTCSGPS